MPEPNEILATAECRIDAMHAEMRANFREESGNPEVMLARPGQKPVLDAVRPDYSMWQRAFWLVSPDEWLDGVCPIDVVRAGEVDRAIEAARHASDIVIG